MILHLLFALIFAFCFYFCFCFSVLIGSIYAKKRERNKRRTSSKKKSKNEEKNATNAKYFISFLVTPFIISYLFILHAMHYNHHFFPMSMLVFIEDNKRSEFGGSFLENLKKFQLLHSFIRYSMHDMIINHVNSKHDLSKTT